MCLTIRTCEGSGIDFQKILDFVYLSEGLSNSFLITTPEGRMVINTGMTVGLLPITGMTLPFVSAGGSSLVTAWMTVGLVLNVGLRRPRRMERWEVAS